MKKKKESDRLMNFICVISYATQEQTTKYETMIIDILF